MVDVVHQRQNPHLRLGEVEVALSVETRGAEHSDRLISALRASGYQVAFGESAGWTSVSRSPRAVDRGRAAYSTPVVTAMVGGQPPNGSKLTTVTLMSAPLGAV